MGESGGSVIPGKRPFYQSEAPFILAGIESMVNIYI